MKSVLLLVHNLAIGGVSTSLINVTRLLVNNECNVTVKTTAAIADQDVLLRIDPRVHVEIMDERRFHILERLPYFRNFFESGCWTKRKKPHTVYRHYVKKGERKKYDVEIAFYFGRPVKAISGSDNNESKKIMWIRLGFLDKGNFAGFRSKELAIEAFKGFDRIIGVSEDVVNDFIENTGISADRVVAVHNFLDRENIDKCLMENCELEKNGFTIACVCRLAPIKNTMMLLKVVHRLQEEGIACGCWFVGDGPCRTEMEEYINTYGVENIIITGFQKNPHKYVKQADLYAFPSLMEGYPNTLADSIYIGTPIVSTRCVGAANILKDGEYGILTDFDEESFYIAVKKMITDKVLYENYKSKLSTYDFDKDEVEIESKLLKIIME